MKTFAPALALILSHTTLCAQEELPATQAPVASAADVAQLQSDMSRTTKLLANTQAELYEIRQVLKALPGLRVAIGTIQQQNRKMQDLLVTLCGEDALAPEPVCAPQTQPAKADAPEVEAFQDDLASLRASLDSLQAQVAALETGGQGQTLSGVVTPAQPKADVVTPDPADDPVPPAIQDLAQVQPFEVDKMPTGLPLFPMRRDIDARVAALPSVEQCPEAGAWLVDHVKDRFDNGLFVNKDGAVRVCKLVQGKWLDFAAGRGDRAHVILSNE